MMTHARALEIRDEELAKLNERAQRLLVGRTILAAVALGHSKSCDSPNLIRLTLDDGSVVELAGGYGGYTGSSCDEYVEVIAIAQVGEA